MINHGLVKREAIGSKANRVRLSTVHRRREFRSKFQVF